MNKIINLIIGKTRIELFFILFFSLSLLVHPAIVGRSKRTVFYRKAVINVTKINGKHIVTATIPALGAVEVFPVPPKEMHPAYNISYFECISVDIKLTPFTGQDGGEIYYRGGCSSKWSLNIRSLTPRKTNPSPKLVNVTFNITKSAMKLATHIARTYNKEGKKKSTHSRSIPFKLQLRHAFIDLRGSLNSRGTREWRGDSSKAEWKSYQVYVPLQINFYPRRK